MFCENNHHIVIVNSLPARKCPITLITLINLITPKTLITLTSALKQTETMVIREMGWRFYREVGSNLEVKKMYTMYQGYVYCVFVLCIFVLCIFVLCIFCFA